MGSEVDDDEGVESRLMSFRTMDDVVNGFIEEQQYYPLTPCKYVKQCAVC